MNELKEAILLKSHDWQYNVIIQYNNAYPTPHPNMTKHKIKVLGWEVLPYPRYSLDLVTSD